jgi:hypothetical protein
MKGTDAVASACAMAVAGTVLLGSACASAQNVAAPELPRPTVDVAGITPEVLSRTVVPGAPWKIAIATRVTYQPGAASEEQHELEAILAEATRRYGKAEMAERGIIRWNAGQTALAVISNDQGLNRIVMVSSGPGFDTCSEKHKSITGHPLSDHWMRFLPNN